MKRIGELKLRIKELDFLIQLKEGQVEVDNQGLDVEEGRAQSHQDLPSEFDIDKSFLKEQDLPLRKQRAYYGKLLAKKVEAVKLDLDIDLSDKLDFHELDNLKITTAFVSFENEEIKNRFKNIKYSEVASANYISLFIYSQYYYDYRLSKLTTIFIITRSQTQKSKLPLRTLLRI